MKDDALSAYFFAIANGRQCCCFIFHLNISRVLVSNPAIIMSHACDFFSDLLSACPTSGFSISPSLWSLENRVTAADNLDLVIPLSTFEIGDAVPS